MHAVLVLIASLSALTPSAQEPEAAPSAPSVRVETIDRAIQRGARGEAEARY